MFAGETFFIKFITINQKLQYLNENLCTSENKFIQSRIDVVCSFVLTITLIILTLYSHCTHHCTNSFVFIKEKNDFYMTFF